MNERLAALASLNAYRVSIRSWDKDADARPIDLKVTVGGDFDEKLTLEIEMVEPKKEED